jgi:hypothetical protein
MFYKSSLPYLKETPSFLGSHYSYCCTALFFCFQIVFILRAKRVYFGMALNFRCRMKI